MKLEASHLCNSGPCFNASHILLETKDMNLNRKGHQSGREPCNCKVRCVRNGDIVWYIGEMPGPNAAPHHRAIVTLDEEDALDTVEGREKMERERLRQVEVLHKYGLDVESTGEVDDETSLSILEEAVDDETSLFVAEEAVQTPPVEDCVSPPPSKQDALTTLKRKARPQPRPTLFIPSTAKRKNIANPSPDLQTRVGFAWRNNGPTAELPPLMKQGVTGIVGRGTKGESRAVYNMIPIDGTPFFEAEAVQNQVKRSRRSGKFMADEYGRHMGTMAAGALETREPQKLRMKRTRCRECYMQDVKCDHMDPCERCTRRNLPCSYDPARLIKDNFTPLPRSFHTSS
jgi:hypothetical protein